MENCGKTQTPIDAPKNGNKRNRSNNSFPNSPPVTNNNRSSAAHHSSYNFGRLPMFFNRKRQRVFNENSENKSSLSTQNWSAKNGKEHNYGAMESEAIKHSQQQFETQIVQSNETLTVEGRTFCRWKVVSRFTF